MKSPERRGVKQMQRATTYALAALTAAMLLLVNGATVAVAGVIDHGAVVRCRYDVTVPGTYGWTEALLKKIVVHPPTVPKTSSDQRVGWRFIVERTLDREFTPWLVVYRSPRQRASS